MSMIINFIIYYLYMTKILLSLIISFSTSYCLYKVLLERKTIILNYSNKFLTSKEKSKIKNINNIKCN